LNPKRILKKLDLDLPGKQPGQEDTVDKAAQATGTYLAMITAQVIIGTLLVDEIIKSEILFMCCGSLCTRQEHIHIILLGLNRNQTFQMNDAGTVNLILSLKS
jgi:hypothetical protein